jgi:tetratricopeptide (TPR) repeat protein
VKRFLFAFAILVTAIFCGGAFANTGDFDAANRLYDEGKFSEAKGAYEKQVESGEWSANLFYNLGNCDYRLGAPGRAMLNYERALALDPGHPEARANITLLRNQNGARVQPLPRFRQVALETRNGVWTIVCAAFGWMAVFCFALIVMGRRAEKAGLWFCAIACLLVCAGAGAALWERARDEALAVVVAKQTEARLAPADSAGLAEALPAGSRVRILSERGDWTYCELPGEGRGWIPHRAIERVRLEKT